jgi:hypothetical protein
MGDLKIIKSKQEYKLLAIISHKGDTPNSGMHPNLSIIYFINIVVNKRRFCFTMELYYTQEFNTQLLITVHNFSSILTLV